MSCERNIDENNGKLRSQIKDKHDEIETSKYTIADTQYETGVETQKHTVDTKDEYIHESTHNEIGTSDFNHVEEIDPELKLDPQLHGNRKHRKRKGENKGRNIQFSTEIKKNPEEYTNESKDEQGDTLVPLNTTIEFKANRSKSKKRNSHNNTPDIVLSLNPTNSGNNNLALGGNKHHGMHKAKGSYFMDNNSKKQPVAFQNTESLPEHKKEEQYIIQNFTIFENTVNIDTYEDIEYFANSTNDEQSGHEERVVFPGKVDRREKVISTKDKRAIIQCIGRLLCFRKRNAKEAGAGTGSVYKYSNGYAYVITCAHNVVYNVERKPKPFDKIVFERIETYERPENVHHKCHKVVKRYTMHARAMLKNDNEYKFGNQCQNDLAILAFRDDDNFYRQIFALKQKIVHLLPINEIPRNVILTHSIYGYPGPKQKGQAEYGELWGMKNKSFVKSQKEAIPNMYIKRHDDNGLFYYNAIDTDAGQSGSAIFLCLKDGTFGIVGVHTGGDNTGSEPQNWGVMLTTKKIISLENKAVETFDTH